MKHHLLSMSIRSALGTAVVLSLAATNTLACVQDLLGEASQFTVLALNNGSLTINSSHSLNGNVGYCSGVVSTTNQKVDHFNGGAFVHSAATFSYTPATFAPTEGIHFGSVEPAVDPQLDQANSDALAASAAAAALAPTHILGVLGDGDSRTVNSTGPVNVVSITSLTYKEDQIDFVSRPGFQDCFVVNVDGDFDFSQSRVNLVGTNAGRILWNFPGASSIDINKAPTVFYGTILAPTGTVNYHNPASFTGAIVALDINLHSDFNIVVSVEQASWGLLKAKYRR